MVDCFRVAEFSCFVGFDCFHIVGVHVVGGWLFSGCRVFSLFVLDCVRVGLFSCCIVFECVWTVLFYCCIVMACLRVVLCSSCIVFVCFRVGLVLVISI